MSYVIFTDGAARGNPGPAGAGFVIYDEKGNEVEKNYQFLGEKTNNQAEYLALIAALTAARKHTSGAVTVKTDSELMARQLTGRYRVKDDSLKKLFAEVLKLTRSFSRVEFVHVTRDKNRVADQLANKAIDTSNT